MEASETKFEWDVRKRLSNIEKHGIDFRQALRAFRDPQSIEYISRSKSSEKRYVLIGLADGQLITVIYVVRGTMIRIISARAPRREKRKLWTANTS